jgi:hypothetical protein
MEHDSVDGSVDVPDVPSSYLLDVGRILTCGRKCFERRMKVEVEVDCSTSTLH